MNISWPPTPSMRPSQLAFKPTTSSSIWPGWAKPPFLKGSSSTSKCVPCPTGRSNWFLNTTDTLLSPITQSACRSCWKTQSSNNADCASLSWPRTGRQTWKMTTLTVWSLSKSPEQSSRLFSRKTSSRSGHYFDCFLFHFGTESLTCLEGGNQWPLVRETQLSSVSPTR